MYTGASSHLDENTAFRFASFVKSKGAIDLCSLIIFIGLHEVAFEDEFRAAEEIEVLCEAQQGRSRVKRKLFRSFRNKMGDVMTLIMEEAHAMKYFIRPGDEIGESKMIGLEMEQETTKVVVIKERLKEAKNRQERVKFIVGNQTFRI
nr:hypothetical protein [Tanacetum cinerariifolium]